MLAYILENPEVVISTATSVVTIASVITASTDTPPPDTWLGKAYKILEVLALVLGKAKRQG
jgi:hypothetical protein